MRGTWPGEMHARYIARRDACEVARTIYVDSWHVMLHEYLASACGCCFAWPSSLDVPFWWATEHRAERRQRRVASGETMGKTLRHGRNTAWNTVTA